MDDEQLAELVSLYNMGHPLGELCRRYGLSPAALYYWLRRAEARGMKVAWRRPGWRRLSREEKRSILELCAAGLPRYRVARIMGVHYATVYRICGPRVD